MNLIERSFHLIAPKAIFEFHCKIGNRIIYKEKNRDSISIVTNRNYYLKWGFVFIGLGIFGIVWLFPNIKHVNWFSIFILAFISLPFIAVGINYLRKSGDASEVKFNSQRKEVILNKKYLLPYAKVKSISISRLGTFAGESERYSYQLNLHYGKNEMILIIDDNYDHIYYAAEFLSAGTGIFLTRELIEV